MAIYWSCTGTRLWQLNRCAPPAHSARRSGLTGERVCVSCWMCSRCYARYGCAVYPTHSIYCYPPICVCVCVCVCMCVCGARVQVAVDPQAAARFHLSTKQCVAVGKSVSEAEKWLSDHGLPHASWDSALGPGAPLRCAKQRGHASMVVWNCTEITVTCLDIGLTCLDIAMSFPTHFPTAT